MKIKRGTARMIDAATLVASDDYLRAHDERLAGEGYRLRPKVRAYACKDGSLSLQFCWTRRLEGRTSTFTIAMRFAA